MTLRVSVNHPHLTEGEVVSVGGILAVPNGGSVDVGPETEQLFIDSNGVSINHYISDDNAILSVSGNAEVDWTPPVDDVEEENASQTTNPVDAALESEGGEE